VIGGIERLIAPLSRILGWHPDFPLDPFVTRTRLDIIERIPVNFFGYWTMLKARNNKG
jgi:phosphatidylethanolamine/phosphatidyl-N-methylethanolamine N-methyltransferase